MNKEERKLLEKFEKKLEEHLLIHKGFYKIRLNGVAK